ncbi:cytochrome P450 oxidoreductase [Fusarium oxysporum f. sp. conglutinans race 2 54008]|uniref:Cytochrome P450 oxidoreductase n=1 Tax=Fusarium oxysporum f. sp. conglutinans race 2 54008 TaxID=1089457 RepID=X0GWL5_FUSOX|nr:cytochrome P450 oxidoreductase [Fusarium oxysporum f. sp. conglutinans race 2 54008]KAG6981844.1 Benzoate 4-monooxygenase [Fusarium oxysporum f. sp. conglutinans]
MYGTPVLIGIILLLFFRFILYPVLRYYADPKELRRYPNMSAVSGITNIPFMIEAVRGFRSRRLFELHKTHPIIRVGPNSLSYGPVGAIKDIYGHGTKCSKDDFYSLVSGIHYHLADVIDKSEHQRKRKVLANAYAIKNLESWEYKITGKMERLIRQFDVRCTEPLSKGSSPDPSDLTVDYRAWTNFFTMDAILDIGLSQSPGFLDRGNDYIVSETVDGKKEIVGYRHVLHTQLTAQSQLVWTYDWYLTLKKWVTLSPKYKMAFNNGEKFDEIVLHQLRERYKRYEKGEHLPDFFQALMEGRDGTPNMLPWGELAAESSIMLNAGSVSTAIAINSTMFLLLKNPDCLAKLQEEIGLVADDEAVLAYEKVKYLPYLRACVDEAMRILPPTSFSIPRKIPPEGCTVLGEFVAGNTTVSMSSYVAHRNERVFPYAEQFRPDRWLGEEGKELQPYFIPFSAGARGCIGRNISYLEQLVLTATVVHRYEFALPSPTWEQSRYEHFNLVPGPMPLKIWRRKSPLAD